jgi:hypothetical protein
MIIHINAFKRLLQQFATSRSQFLYEETMISLMQSLPLSYSTLVNSLRKHANL